MKKLILVLTLIVFFTTAFLCADVYIKTKTHVGAFEMMGQKQPAKDELQEQWIGKNKFAQMMKQQTIIIDLDKKMLYIANHGAKTYIETSLPLDMTKLLPEQMAQMMKSMKISVTVNPNGQTKTIGKWNCSGYDVVMDIQFMMPMKMKMLIWATTDVPFDWKAFVDKMYPAIMKAQSVQMPFGDDVINAFKKIKGYQVATEMTMNMMGTDMKVNTEVLEITNKPAPAGTYAVPAGYSKKEKFSMMDLQKR
jgi:hypothetical protein